MPFLLLILDLRIKDMPEAEEEGKDTRARSRSNRLAVISRGSSQHQ